MKIEIKKSNILPFLAVGTLFYSLFPIYIWGTAMAANSRTIAVCLGTAYILTNINIIKCKKYVWHLMYIAVIVLSFNTGCASFNKKGKRTNKMAYILFVDLACLFNGVGLYTSGN